MESEERFRLLIQHVKDYAIFMIDPEGRVISWNQGAERIKGYTEAEVIGRPISIFYSDDQNQAGEPAYNLRQAIEAGRYETIGLRRRKDASLFCADVTITTLYDTHGNLRGFAKITRDITEQQNAEEEVRNALKRERELNELKSRFVTMASHEFKTPLSVILSSIALIEKYQGDGTTLDEKRLKHIHRVRSNVNNLRQILNDFLSIEKLEEGMVKNTPYETNMPDFLEEIVQDMNEGCTNSQQINLHILGQPQLLFLDGQLLRNILNNLLSNAIKYSPDHSTIGFTVRFDPGFLTINIRDSGIGIPAEEQEHLFERFFRATNTTGIAGTGLGLSIVKRYVDLMGGTIHVKSAAGTGTDFTVILPSVPAHALCT